MDLSCIRKNAGLFLPQMPLPGPPTWHLSAYNGHKRNIRSKKVQYNILRSVMSGFPKETCTTFFCKKGQKYVTKLWYNLFLVRWQVGELYHGNNRNFGPHYNCQYRRHRLSDTPGIQIGLFSFLNWVEFYTPASTRHPISKPLPHIRMYRSWPVLEKL